MTYTKINLYLANGIPEALSNLWYGSDSSVVEIRDSYIAMGDGFVAWKRCHRCSSLVCGCVCIVQCDFCSS